MDTIKKILKWAVWAFAAFCAFCLLIAIFSDDEKPNSQVQTEQKVESEKQNKATETKKEKKVEEKKEESFVGTYEVTDKIGNKIRITLNNDKTATIKEIGGNNTTYYCSWDYFDKKVISIEFSDIYPYLIYDGGEAHDMVIYLKDGWLYSFVARNSNNPNWRLKATKIK